MCSHYEYTQYTIFNIQKEIALNYPKSAAIGFCYRGLKNEFETAVVIEPSGLEPLEFYRILLLYFQVTCTCCNLFWVTWYSTPL